MRKLFKVFGLTAPLVLLIGCGGTESTSKPVASVTPTATLTPTPTKTHTAFSTTAQLHGIKFKVESPNSESNNKVTVTPSGLSGSIEPVTSDVNGDVYGAESGDLNVDQSPEIYIYVRERDGKKRASLIGYSANSKKSMSEISVPAIDPASKEAAGLNGEDEFAVVENTLVRRFPLFAGTGDAAKKTGKFRQFDYKLKKGEATWALYVNKVEEY